MAHAADGPGDRDALRAMYRATRAATLRLAAPLAPEDMVVQSMPDASPTKWHLAHTTWFFETFVLRRAEGFPYAPLEPRYESLFNSYYNAVGEAFPRASRGVVSRPTVAEVLAYRAHVDAAMDALLARAGDAAVRALAGAIELGVNHEEQHQELVLTDLKHAFAQNPLEPAYVAGGEGGEPGERAGEAEPLGWVAHPGGIVEVGAGAGGFAFDNERPRHRALLTPFALADRLVTAGEYAAFIEDGGYARPELWLSEGWATVRARGWDAPLYWRRAAGGGAARAFTLRGARATDPREPVAHVSYYEADAYARWAGARLPREAEWEAVAQGARVEGNLLESGALHPRALGRRREGRERVAQLFGDVWEWTASPYVGYPGFRPFEGAFGEYNGKFMVNQLVLRGGSCATPARHVRASYRNFFPPDARWQFSGIRLARDA